MSPYCNRQASLATKHGKQRAIARPFRHALGLAVVTPPDLDTDLLGTFCGETARIGSAQEVCEHKARLGMAATGLPLGLASEGSFGPHPFVPFIPAGIEIMTFVDADRGLVISETELAENTNYGHRVAASIEELADWLPAVGFPAHALIVRVQSGGPGNVYGCAAGRVIEKGIVSPSRLKTALAAAVSLSDEGKAFVETDMRAHCNPTRMAGIRRLSFRLARRVASLCPACSAPGWGQTGTVKGLPCEGCAAPTGMVRFEVFTCAACSNREDRPRNDGRTHAAQQHCPDCNP